MTNYKAEAPKSFSGPWTVYRRKDDADMWERFEGYCARSGVSVSQVLAEAARAYVNFPPR